MMKMMMKPFPGQGRSGGARSRWTAVVCGLLELACARAGCDLLSAVMRFLQRFGAARSCLNRKGLGRDSGVHTDTGGCDVTDVM
ncbi:hypothetical protein LDENG_00176110 [Lucifuga dentata]|nr:hypothetical protein LDENG_00176110 [Lucifuga dentata]